MVRFLGRMMPILDLRNIPTLEVFKESSLLFARKIMSRTRLKVTDELFMRDTAVPI